MHEARFAPSSFNPTDASSRFRPFPSGRRIVATMYAAADVPAALSESIFRDIPPHSPDQVVLRSRLIGYVRSRIVIGRELRLVSLRGGGPRRLRTSAAALIHTDHTAYPATARWAAAIYRWPGRADGILWDSRQHPGSPAMILWATRVRARRIAFDYDDIEPLWKGVGLEEVLAAAEDAGITIVL